MHNSLYLDLTKKLFAKAAVAYESLVVKLVLGKRTRSEALTVILINILENFLFKLVLSGEMCRQALLNIETFFFSC